MVFLHRTMISCPWKVIGKKRAPSKMTWQMIGWIIRLLRAYFNQSEQTRVGKSNSCHSQSGEEWKHPLHCENPSVLFFASSSIANLFRRSHCCFQKNPRLLTPKPYHLGSDGDASLAAWPDGFLCECSCLTNLAIGVYGQDLDKSIRGTCLVLGILATRRHRQRGRNIDWLH